MFTTDRDGDGVMDSDDDGTLPYGKPLSQNIPELSRRLKIAIESASGSHITCNACMQTLMSIDAGSEPERIAKQIVPNLQLSPEIRNRIGGINQQYEWVTEIIRAVFSEMGA